MENNLDSSAKLKTIEQVETYVYYLKEQGKLYPREVLIIIELLRRIDVIISRMDHKISPPSPEEIKMLMIERNTYALSIDFILTCATTFPFVNDCSLDVIKKIHIQRQELSLYPPATLLRKQVTKELVNE